MELVLCGSWLGSEGFYRAKLKRVDFFSSLQEVTIPSMGFVILSYGLSEETLGIRVKSSSLPKVVLFEVEDFEKTEIGYKRVVGEKLASTSKEEYTKGVRKVKELIAQGVIYQLNLTARFDYAILGSPKDLFSKYYTTQPVPYAFFADLEDFYVLSGSMELFLEKRGDHIVSKPIKGTARSKEYLEKSQKDKAENLMITDMVRNDLSRIALRGSVRVEKLFEVEEFATLFQMHSTVVAKTQKDFKEIIYATFPPASVVGAPKRKAVEVINSLETHSRDYYCGCAGLLMGQDFTLSVLIRSAIGKRDKLSYFAGAGIVYDSEPEKEWEEVLLKAEAFERSFIIGL